MRSLRQTPRKIPALMMLCVLVCSSGCVGRTRTIYLKATQPVRLAEDVQAHVWIKDKDGNDVKSGNKVTLPEGSYDISDPEAPPTPAEKAAK